MKREETGGTVVILGRVENEKKRDRGKRLYLGG